jgi:PfaD family protein
MTLSHAAISLPAAILPEQNVRGASVVTENETEYLRQQLMALDTPLWLIKQENAASLVPVSSSDNESLMTCTAIACLPPSSPEQLGSAQFRQTYQVRCAYMSGAMANGIASTALVIAMGQAGYLGSFGAAGLPAAAIEAAIQTIQAALPDGPYAFNLINSPNDPAAERETAALYVRYNVPVVEASAYLGLTEPLVYYRASGLSRDVHGKVNIGHHIIAKVSRKEIAKRFLEPPSTEMLKRLVENGQISLEQAELAAELPVADDITVEADSGGHTDNRPLINALPAIIALRDEIQAQRNYADIVRVGAAGGIATPLAVHAAFQMGADYVVTGSINQACVEAGASAHTRNLLAQAEMTDVIMAPAADMFEMGVKVQVLKRGTMFGMRALKLSELYNRFSSLEEIPAEERAKLETTVFKRAIEEIWADTQTFFQKRDPRQLERAEKDPHQKMALVFRWYLGMSSRWSNSGEPGREMDYQIWCGPAMGAFNQWTRGTFLAEPANRSVTEVARQLLRGAAYLNRIALLEALGCQVTPLLKQTQPE